MLSASLQANKRGFDMEALNIKSSNIKFSIGKIPSAWPRLEPLAPGHKREKVSIYETQVSVSG